MGKKIHKKIDRDDESITITEIQDLIDEIQKENPDRDVFFDGDEFAICSRKKKEG